MVLQWFVCLLFCFEMSRRVSLSVSKCSSVLVAVDARTRTICIIGQVVHVQSKISKMTGIKNTSLFVTKRLRAFLFLRFNAVCLFIREKGQKDRRWCCVQKQNTNRVVQKINLERLSTRANAHERSTSPYATSRKNPASVSICGHSTLLTHPNTHSPSAQHHGRSACTPFR